MLLINLLLIKLIYDNKYNKYKLLLDRNSSFTFTEGYNDSE